MKLSSFGLACGLLAISPFAGAVNLAQNPLIQKQLIQQAQKFSGSACNSDFLAKSIVVDNETVAQGYVLSLIQSTETNNPNFKIIKSIKEKYHYEVVGNYSGIKTYFMAIYQPLQKRILMYNCTWH